MTSHDLRSLRARVVEARPSAGLDDISIGRIEEWVVRTLDRQSRALPETLGSEWVDGFASIKPKVESGPNAPTSGGATPRGAWARFRLSRRKDVAIVSLTDQALIKEADLSELLGDLAALVETGHLRIVLDFFAVERLSSWAATMLNRGVGECSSRSGASFKFSGLRQEVSAMFAMMGLDPRIAIYPDSSSAIQGLWPDLPALQPLPVSILSALMRAEDVRPRRSGRLSSREISPPQFGPGPSRWASEDRPDMTGARLIAQDGPFLGKSIPIPSGRFLIGRGVDCQLRIGSAEVSRSHARIERRGRSLFLRDLASTNGSVLNGRAIRGREVEIGDGDRLQFGPLTFALAIGEASSRFQRPDFEKDRLASWSQESQGSTTDFDALDDLGDQPGLKHEVIEGVLVITPLALDLDDEEAVDGLRSGLMALNSRRFPGRVVINLAHLVHLSGRAIGVLVAHHLRLDRSGGALRVCVANPRVALVMEQVKLGMLVEYHPTVEEAVLAAWPEPVASPA